MDITYVETKEKKKNLVKTILADLPEWFGLPESTAEYIEKSVEQVMLSVENKGFLTLVKTSPVTAEIHVMGVLKAYHREGIGRQLIEGALKWCQENGCLFLQVKTLAETHADLNYRGARHFYQTLGFFPVETFPLLWGKENPCLQLIQVVPEIGKN